MREFLQREQKNGGVLMLMLHFMESLCDRAELSWPQELASVYVKVYTRWRKHVDLPCLLRLDLFSGATQEVCVILLQWVLLSCWKFPFKHLHCNIFFFFQLIAKMNQMKIFDHLERWIIFDNFSDKIYVGHNFKTIYLLQCICLHFNSKCNFWWDFLYFVFVYKYKLTVFCRCCCWD